MRDSQSGKAPQTFGHCLMDSDPEVQRLARRIRRRSMILSTLIQAGLLTTAIVVPLFASHTLKLYTQTPTIPVPRGERLAEVKPAGNKSSSSSGPRTPKIDGLFEPPRIPKDIPAINDIGDGPPSLPAQIGGCPGCSPDGVDGVPPLFDSTRTTPAPRPSEPAPKPRGPVVVSKGVQEAKLIHRVEPRYPPLMLQIRKEGRVEFRAIIASDGTIRELTLVSGHPGFVYDAQSAVLQWRYSPTLLNGEPVEVQTYITVIFVLSR